MSVLAVPPLLQCRSRWRRPRVWALLSLLVVLTLISLPLAAHDAAAAAKGKRYGAPLKFDSPPVDLGGSAPAPAPAEASEVQPPPVAAPAQAPPPPVATNDDAAPTSGEAKPVRLFGTVEFRSPVKNLPKWERVRDSEARNPSFEGGGMDVPNDAVSQKWKSLREKLRNAPLMEQMRGVNAFFNQWPYKTDIEIWGVEDYWETPREFTQKSGDCEDYAIAKYYGLRDLGVPSEILRVTAVKDAIRNIGHAVTVVLVDGDAYVLDNLSSQIFSHKRLTNYKPIFSVNEQYLWRHIQPQSGPTK